MLVLNASKIVHLNSTVSRLFRPGVLMLSLTNSYIWVLIVSNCIFSSERNFFSLPSSPCFVVIPSEAHLMISAVFARMFMIARRALCRFWTSVILEMVLNNRGQQISEIFYFLPNVKNKFNKLSVLQTFLRFVFVVFTLGCAQCCQKLWGKSSENRRTGEVGLLGRIRKAEW